MGAIEKLKNGKAAGDSGVHPEMVKVACIGDEFPKKFLELVHDMWKEKNVPTEWRDAILIPIQKKGDLSHCDNWRGISFKLLDVAGKVGRMWRGMNKPNKSCPHLRQWPNSTRIHQHCLPTLLLKGMF